MEFDSQKILHYNQLFSRWKNELFPRREYAYENECCYAFAHKLAAKAKENGFTPLKAWCLESSSRTYPEDTPLNFIREPKGKSTVSVMRPTDDPLTFKECGWSNYHVALVLDVPVYKDSPKTEKLVFDPIVFDGVVTLKQWQTQFNARDYQVELSGCDVEGKDRTILNGGSGYWRAPNPGSLDVHANRQLENVNCSGRRAEKHSLAISAASSAQQPEYECYKGFFRKNGLINSFIADNEKSCSCERTALV